ncbi:MAG TPA: winged helix DNA-binding domain-containing protein [Micromonosporaceae bacterium]
MSARTPIVSRAQVLSYRINAQQLHRVDVPADQLAVLDIGVQDTPYGSARQALAVRTSCAVEDAALRLVWSVRGAPHLHRSSDLPSLVAALWPFDDADAAVRMSSGQIKDGARLGLAAFEQTARALREVVRRPMTKGEVSAAVSARVDPALTFDCRPCQARHISGNLLQQAGLAGGVELRVAGRTTGLAPLREPVRPPTACRGVTGLILAYLRLLGPATPAEVAKFLGTTPAHLRARWPKDLAEVRVEGRRAWLPVDRLDSLQTAEPASIVRLLPPGDPFLQARDRQLVVPDRSRQSQVWRALANPGVLLVDGEIAGIWRSRTSGTKAVVSVTAFDRLSPRVRSAVSEETERMAAAKGLAAADVSFG